MNNRIQKKLEGWFFNNCFPGGCTVTCRKCNGPKWLLRRFIFFSNHNVHVHLSIARDRENYKLLDNNLGCKLLSLKCSIKFRIREGGRAASLMDTVWSEHYFCGSPSENLSKFPTGLLSDSIKCRIRGSSGKKKFPLPTLHGDLLSPSMKFNSHHCHVHDISWS